MTYKLIHYRSWHNGYMTSQSITIDPSYPGGAWFYAPDENIHYYNMIIDNEKCEIITEYEKFEDATNHMIKLSQYRDLEDIVEFGRSPFSSCETIAWSDVITFGGRAPSETIGCWSWDEERVLVGDSIDELEIVTRAEWDEITGVWTREDAEKLDHGIL